MIVKFDDKTMKAIDDILRRGNDVIIRKRKDSFIILEEQKKVIYDPCGMGRKEGQ